MLFAAHKLSEKDMKKVKTMKHLLKARTNKELFLKLVAMYEKQYGFY